jgi:ABC-2 type transport system ATP-binding protein
MRPLTISFKKVTKWRSLSFEGPPVLSEMNWNLEGCGVHALLGPNGSGKSTSLQLILGLLLPDYGEVTVMDFHPVQARQYLSGVIGYVPDTPPLYPHLTVKEYLRYLFDIRRTPQMAQDKVAAEKKWQTQLEKIVSVMKLGEWLHRPCGQLSYGLKGRVALAQGFIHDPVMIIMDEPTKGLDPESLVLVREFFQSEKNSKFLLYCTHHLRDLPLMSDTVSIISQGSIAYFAPVKDMLPTTDFESLYLTTVKKHEITNHP